MRLRSWIAVALPVLVVAGFARSQDASPSRGAKTSAPESRAKPNRESKGEHVAPYTEDLFQLTEANANYRRVLFTGERSQLVVMSIPPGQSIGTEKHAHVEQTIVIMSGSGQVLLDGARTNVGGGDVVVITPGTKHDVVNTGTRPLQLFTTYVPPNHIDRRVHKTKQDAEHDTEDQRYGSQVE